MKPLWSCPRCHHEFVTENLWHSCGKYELDDHFRNTQPNVRAVFDRYREMVESLGPVTVYAQKTRIIFMVRVRFAGAMTRKAWLQTHLWLLRRADHPKLARVELFPPRNHIHTFKFSDPSELDDSFRQLLAEAYRVGCQEHL